LVAEAVHTICIQVDVYVDEPALYVPGVVCSVKIGVGIAMDDVMLLHVLELP
jgi:hypothetical protein